MLFHLVCIVLIFVCIVSGPQLLCHWYTIFLVCVHCACSAFTHHPYLRWKEIKLKLFHHRQRSLQIGLSRLNTGSSWASCWFWSYTLNFNGLHVVAASSDTYALLLVFIWDAVHLVNVLERMYMYVTVVIIVISLNFVYSDSLPTLQGCTSSLHTTSIILQQKRGTCTSHWYWLLWV